MNVLKEKKLLNIADAQKFALLSDEELKASLGILMRKSIIKLKKDKIILNINEEEISKKTSEEILMESLPKNYDLLSKEQKENLKFLLKNKGK